MRIFLIDSNDFPLVFSSHIYLLNLFCRKYDSSDAGKASGTSYFSGSLSKSLMTASNQPVNPNIAMNTHNYHLHQWSDNNTANMNEDIKIWSRLLVSILNAEERSPVSFFSLSSLIRSSYEP
jgi:hypothetical protein